MWEIVGGIYFCGRSILAFSKNDWGIKEKYRKDPGRAKWQKRKALLSAVIGINSFLLLIAKENKAAAAIVASLFIVALLLDCINDYQFSCHTQGSEEEREGDR